MAIFVRTNLRTDGPSALFEAHFEQLTIAWRCNVQQGRGLLAPNG